MRTNIFWGLHKGAYEALNDRGITGKIFVEEDDIMAMEIKEQNYSNLEQVNTETPLYNFLKNKITHKALSHV